MTDHAEKPDFLVAIPTMKSLFIEMYFGDLKIGTGTAFLAANAPDAHCALITNRHNVTGRHQETQQSLHSKGAIPDAMVIHFHKAGQTNGEWLPIRLPLYRPCGTPYWIEHPLLGATADLVALNLSWGSDIIKYPYYMQTELDRVNIEIGPAEPISVIGFPFGLSSTMRFPLWATGFLAQELTLMTPDNPVFMIDCRTRRGQSGSAVIAYRAGGYRSTKDGRPITTMSAGTVWEFLGIYSGRINDQSDLGRVWHRSAVEEVLDAAAEEARIRA
ncbi:hypothetical protein [Novosphingobium colocasiae]|uniref:hypothetical protein n=1 Tax=Novosphingobium colocasiae TaxID=1256513 RepID=UPI0035AD7A19